MTQSLSNENQDVDQITKVPETQAKKKEKDPKKVAAGRKLAEYNKKAKEALEREMKRAEEKDLPGDEGGGGAWLPELSFTAVLSIAGIGFTTIDLFSRFYKKEDSEIRPVTRTIHPSEVAPKKEPTPPPNTPVPQNRMGMA